MKTYVGDQHLKIRQGRCVVILVWFEEKRRESVGIVVPSAENKDASDKFYWEGMDGGPAVHRMGGREDDSWQKWTEVPP